MNAEAELLDNGRISGSPSLIRWTIENSQLVVHCSDGTLYKYALPADWAATRTLKGTAGKDEGAWEIRLLRR